MLFGVCESVERTKELIVKFFYFSFYFSLFGFWVRTSILYLIAALSVRFLTKRYIGEYDHQTGTFYLYHLLCVSNQNDPRAWMGRENVHTNTHSTRCLHEIQPFVLFIFELIMYNILRLSAWQNRRIQNSLHIINGRA